MEGLMSFTTLPAKDPGETVDISFVFGNELGVGETVSTVACVCTVLSAIPVIATDPAPSAVLVGTPSVAATSIQRVHGGLDANTYELLCTATTNLGRVLIRKGIMPVMTN
jgi:hypothetical protein